ncbi:CDP-diacylglycerol--glycerol-3-phosphate 3-phosphatidyltransferase [Perkinsela sp. CCAP 1560/4]|nr:CDP-diacylglycerol--glycerol-3-phosphate 3-phosphatidyltransferase [Perkinsela sp. CCAP 1560/4]|eukprot:KNH09432.1 CDP-diacylglycerol--glycerol-3-phosphate 3-phosphatidyltransferase [Perkinsela sp. CCAP 1560/4]
MYELRKSCYQDPKSWDSEVSISSTKLTNAVASSFEGIYTPIHVDSESIHFLHSPSDFYSEILRLVQSATSRLVLASLYFSCESDRERTLIRLIEKQIEKKPQLKLIILLDRNRMQRSGSEFISRMTRLQNQNPGRVRFSLFEMPSCLNALQLGFDSRFREFIGVFHMKIYIADNNCLWSGANLSEQYFSSRTDRYMLIENSPDLCDYCYHVARLLELHAFLSKASRSSRLRFPFRSLFSNWRKFPRSAKETEIQRLQRFLKALMSMAPQQQVSSSCDTVVYPFFQYGPGGVHNDPHVVNSLIETVSKHPNCNLSLASAYSNFTPPVMHKISSVSDNKVRILTSALSCNSFNGGSGVTQLVPHFYDHLIQSFCSAVQSGSAHHRISVWSWYKYGCTFHAKGLWVGTQDNNQRVPVMVIGSSNLGSRSEHCDLEFSMVVATTNEKLQLEIGKECMNLFADASCIHHETHEKKSKDQKFTDFVFQVAVSFVARQIQRFL